MNMYAHAIGTELELSPGPWSQVFRGRAYCPDGVVRRVMIGTPDTFFTCPARVKAFGKWVSGFTTMGDLHSKSSDSEKVVMFTPLPQGKNCGVFYKWTGVRSLKLYAKWYGGSGYSHPMFNAIESFDSLVEAKKAFGSRLHDTFYPCVNTKETRMFLYYATSKHAVGDDPDLVLRFGKCLGIQVERN